jgi:hypothetical protein
MAVIIKEQNEGIIEAMNKYPARQPTNNLALCDMLKLEMPPQQYKQDYDKSDVRVSVI